LSLKKLIENLKPSSIIETPLILISTRINNDRDMVKA
jgi:hypothetical protein